MYWWDPFHQRLDFLQDWHNWIWLWNEMAWFAPILTEIGCLAKLTCLDVKSNLLSVSKEVGSPANNRFGIGTKFNNSLFGNLPTYIVDPGLDAYIQQWFDGDCGRSLHVGLICFFDFNEGSVQKVDCCCTLCCPDSDGLCILYINIVSMNWKQLCHVFGFWR